MNKKTLLLSSLLFFSTVILSADSQIRLGVLNGTGTFYTETEILKGPTQDMNNISGLELSLVVGKHKAEGFNYRSVLTVQKNSWTTENLDVSDIMILGEGEFAYNINEYVSPFFGLYGGLGSSNYSLNNSNQLTYDVGLNIGVSGDFIKNFGYYAKYNFFSLKGFDIYDDSLDVQMRPATLRIGLSYTF